jgi:hypothetical protein
LVDIFLACLRLSTGVLWLEGRFEESEIEDGRFLNASVVGTATPSADVSVSVHLGYRCNRVLSLERRGDMLIPRQSGGFYKITGPDGDGPNSLVPFFHIL